MKKENKRKLDKNLQEQDKLLKKRNDIDDKIDNLKKDEERIISEEIILCMRTKNISLVEAINRLNGNEKENK